MGAADLIANGKDVAVIGYHTGDAYTNSYGTSRLILYGLTGSPTAWFDGGNSVVGGSNNTSMYSSYLPKYNQRKNIQSSFTIDVEGSNSGLIDYDLEITIEKVATSSATNIALHVVVTESDIQQNWQGMTELHHVERLMAPNENGTSLDFSGGDIVVKDIDFIMNPEWVNENCELIVFVQDVQTKEVLQAIKRDLTEFGTTNVNDAALLQLMAPQYVCQNSFTPKVTIGNYGLDNLSSLDIVYYVNGETPMTYSWTGNLSTYESEIVELDAISFVLMDENTFIANCENPNGQADEYPDNNTITMNMDGAPDVTSPVSLALKLDDNPEETTWELWDSSGEMLYSGGPYSTPGQFIVEQFLLDDIDCYSFVIYDEGGDGLTGNGMYKLVHQGTSVIVQGSDFGSEDQIQFGVGLVGVENHIMADRFSVSPNPVNDETTISFILDNPEEVQMMVFNTIGKMVYSTARESYQPGPQSIKFIRGDLESGIYFIRLSYGENLLAKKIILK